MGFMDNLDDPQKQALLAAAFGLLGGQGGKGFGGFARDVGQAGLLGLNRYAVANEDKRRSGLVDDQRKMHEMQLAQLKRQNEYQSGYDSLAKQYFNQGSPGVQPLTPNDDEGNAMPSFPAQAPRADFQGFMGALPSLGGQGVKDALSLQQSMAKDSAFSKIDPKDYTADSIRKFAASAQVGKPDFSILVPVRKLENVEGTARNMYSDATPSGADLFGPQSQVVKDKNGNWTFNPARINPMEQARVGIAQAELGLNFARARDEGIGGTGVSPKQQREVGFDVAKQGALASDKQSRGANDVLYLLEQAKPLIAQSTNSWIGRGVDMAGRVVGQATSGDVASSQLKAIEGALISKMPRMEGPQSDRDVKLYIQAAGQLGDATVPSEIKAAAVRTIEEIQSRYAGKNPADNPAARTGASGGTGKWRYLGTGG